MTQTQAFAADAIEKDPLEVAGIAAESAMDLNTMTVAQLMTLPGIGESKARAIVAYRDEKGYFHDVEQLTEVKGIGQKMLAKIRDKVKVVKH
ncbi:helix-hairpin-helix domain-containing protein [Aestuariibacter sp. A3R04]|nr:helix-hairpin-helix domain-containing protein [Aestuariibacter sp. A3R04]